MIPGIYYRRRLSKDITDQAFDIMLPFYGIKNKAERRRALKTGAMHQMARVMRELNRKSIADKMEVFDIS